MSHALLHGLLNSCLYHGRAICVDVLCVDNSVSWQRRHHKRSCLEHP